jgi:hypothetical protein
VLSDQEAVLQMLREHAQDCDHGSAEALAATAAALQDCTLQETTAESDTESAYCSDAGCDPAAEGEDSSPEADDSDSSSDTDSVLSCSSEQYKGSAEYTKYKKNPAAREEMLTGFIVAAARAEEIDVALEEGREPEGPGESNNITCCSSQSS